MKEEIAQLKARLLSRERDKAQPQINQAALITSIIRGMLFQGLMLVPLTSFPHLSLGFPSQQQPHQFPPPPLQPFAQHTCPHPYSYPHVKHATTCGCGG